MRVSDWTSGLGSDLVLGQVKGSSLCSRFSINILSGFWVLSLVLTWTKMGKMRVLGARLT